MSKVIPVIFAMSVATVLSWSETANAQKAVKPLKVGTTQSGSPLKIRGPVFLNSPQSVKIWTVPEICKAYNFPTKLTGGSVIGIAEFGGGYFKSDLTLFSQQYMNGTPINITDVSVDGTVNSPGSGADAEVALDIQIAAGAYYYCTGKAPTIKVFFAGQNAITDDEFIDSITKVINAAAAAGCDVLSISWGTAENYVTNSVALNLEAAAVAATKKGMVIFAASGDGDATNERQGEVDGQNHLILPSSAPHVVAVGGTTKTTVSEFVWNNRYTLGTPYPLGTGGGYSTVFPVQSFQIGAPVAPAANNGKGRMVPDVTANADPNTPYDIALYGFIQAAGNGTSAATPLWAGLVSSFSKGQKLGNISPTLWLPANRSAYKDITTGDNKATSTAVGFTAAVGPDASSGLGAPIGTEVYKILTTPVAPPTPPVVPSNVTVVYTAGTLTITGDANANSCTVSVQAGTLQVQGANATKINNSTNPFSVSVPSSIVIVATMGDGNDSLQFTGVSASKATVTLGAGNDSAAFPLCNITTLNIDGGTGTNLLLTTSAKIGTLNATNF